MAEGPVQFFHMAAIFMGVQPAFSLLAKHQLKLKTLQKEWASSRSMPQTQGKDSVIKIT